MADEKAAPAEHTGKRGDSFYNPALVGSGTIQSDGTYGPPLPDPNANRSEPEQAEPETKRTGRSRSN